VTDISTVEFWEASTKKSNELAQQKAGLNMSEEADVYAAIINKNDEKAAQELEQISRATQKVTESLRKANGLTFAVEK